MLPYRKKGCTCHSFHQLIGVAGGVDETGNRFFIKEAQSAPAGCHHVELAVVACCDKHPVFGKHFYDVSGILSGAMAL